MDEFSRYRARKLLEVGLDAIAQGDLEVARTKFQQSAECLPTADAFTYWGWMEHHRGETKKAIKLCQKAIKLDPDFGNPYNDIGSYLVALGKEDESIPWFEKAIGATRYEPRQFPHINLGRVYMAKEMPLRALGEFRKALEYAPSDAELRALVDSLENSLN